MDKSSPEMVKGMAAVMIRHQTADHWPLRNISKGVKMRVDYTYMDNKLIISTRLCPYFDYVIKKIYIGPLLNLLL